MFPIWLICRSWMNLQVWQEVRILIMTISISVSISLIQFNNSYYNIDDDNDDDGGGFVFDGDDYDGSIQIAFVIKELFNQSGCMCVGRKVDRMLCTVHIPHFVFAIYILSLEGVTMLFICIEMIVLKF